MKRLVNLIPTISLAVVMFASFPVAASAANPGQHEEGRHPSLVGTIHGRGMANMIDMSPPGVTKFSIDVKLFSNHSARGKVDCVDLDPFGYRGDISGNATRWSQTAEDGPVTVYFIGSLVAIPSGFPFPPASPIYFTVTIQHFGGAGVARWTMDVPPQLLFPKGLPSPNNGGPICQELVTSGHIVGKGELFRIRHRDE